MNQQAGILRIITKNQIQQGVKKDFLGRIKSKIEIQFAEFVHLNMACSV